MKNLKSNIGKYSDMKNDDLKLASNRRLCEIINQNTNEAKLYQLVWDDNFRAMLQLINNNDEILNNIKMDPYYHFVTPLELAIARKIPSENNIAIIYALMQFESEGSIFYLFCNYAKHGYCNAMKKLLKVKVTLIKDIGEEALNAAVLQKQYEVISLIVEKMDKQLVQEILHEAFSQEDIMLSAAFYKSVPALTERFADEFQRKQVISLNSPAECKSDFIMPDSEESFLSGNTTGDSNN